MEVLPSLLYFHLYGGHTFRQQTGTSTTMHPRGAVRAKSRKSNALHPHVRERGICGTAYRTDALHRGAGGCGLSGMRRF